MNDLKEMTTVEKDVIRQYIIKIREGDTDPLIGPTEMGKLMDFSKPRAYAIMDKLEEMRILDKIDRKGFFLTPFGKQIVNELIHRTKVLETYFHRELGVDLEIAENDAQNVVLHISVELVDKICHIMGQPTTCPHNYIIPHHES